MTKLTNKIHRARVICLCAATISALVAMGFCGSVYGADLPRQVLINVEVWEITASTLSSLGVNWNYVGGNEDYQGSEIKLPAFEVTDDYGWKGGFLAAKIGTVEAEIQAALRANKAKVLANPKIVATDNEKAEIKTVEKIPYITKDPSADALKTLHKQVGVNLIIKPRIISDEYVQLFVNPTVSEVLSYFEQEVDGKLYELPVSAERTARTNVLLKSGAKFVLAGLFQQRQVDGASRVPILGSVPILGNLFKSKTKETKKTDLIIIITPYKLLPENGYRLPYEVMMPEVRTEQDFGSEAE